MPCGSSACLMARIIESATGDWERASLSVSSAPAPHTRSATPPKTKPHTFNAGATSCAWAANHQHGLPIAAPCEGPRLADLPGSPLVGPGTRRLRCRPHRVGSTARHNHGSTDTGRTHRPCLGPEETSPGTAHGERRYRAWGRDLWPPHGRRVEEHRVSAGPPCSGDRMNLATDCSRSVDGNIQRPQRFVGIQCLLVYAVLIIQRAVKPNRVVSAKPVLRACIKNNFPPRLDIGPFAVCH